MTEEIINGIDVSECCFYNNSKCDNPNGMACNCINNAVCYFKELKRLEQENKELKSVLEEIRELLIICQEFRTCKRCKFYKECNKDLEGCITDKINKVLGTEA